MCVYLVSCYIQYTRFESIGYNYWGVGSGCVAAEERHAQGQEAVRADDRGAPQRRHLGAVGPVGRPGENAVQ